ncbi:MAG: L-seryl-tRNA(Sec) selenium transferase [Actinomycetota bacterium]
MGGDGSDDASARVRPPSIDALARRLATAVDIPHALLVDCSRRAVAAGGSTDEIVHRAHQLVGDLATALIGPVLNATGVLLHTNLGRAPYPATGAGSASTLEFDRSSGGRGSRHRSVSELIRVLTGAEAAIVVNNNAAAVLLVLAALADGRGVAVSRGESVEIGGGFRIPEVMERSGARLVDVGTTNRTRVEDYRRAVDDPRSDIALILKVHPSNFTVEGFTEQATVDGLADLGVPVVADVGSGLLDATAPWLGGALSPLPSWISAEPAVRQSLDAGASLITFSGDKLLGGPQCGIIAGRRDLVDICGRHPLMRALRPGGHAIAPLQEVLLAYLRRDVASTVPFWAMVTRSVASLTERAEAVVAAVGRGRIVTSSSLVGAGSAPGTALPSVAVALEGDVAGALRLGDPPVIARVEDGRTLLDLRSLPPDHDGALVDAVRALGR